jgi:predicted metal-dependent phosphotriesterase family hydrolase
MKIKMKLFFSSLVLGPVDASQLGRTLTHEHVSASVRNNPDVFYRVPPEEIANLPNFNPDVITLENNGLVQQYP